MKVSRRSATQALCIASAIALIALAFERGAGTHTMRRGGPPLLAPIASLFASVEWVLVDEAFRAGEPVRAFELAERALAFDPGASEGYGLLIQQQALTLASVLREPDGERRRAWLASAVATAERGMEQARDPGFVALVLGVGLYVQATGEDPPPWPGRAGGLVDEARLWFERAREFGRPEAAAFLTALESPR